MLIRIENLFYKYPDGHEALKGVNLTLNEGEKIALVGANGSGKSTLLLHVAGAFEIQSGKIFFDDVEVNSKNSNLLRQNVGLIFQDSDDQLLMPTVIEDVAFSPVASGEDVAKSHKIADEILTSLGISNLSSRPPHKLSGGEKRIVSFAGVLAKNPKILALDEPTANLDPSAKQKVVNFLRQSEKTILLATHDLDIASDICSRAVVLSEGVVVAEGQLPGMFTDFNFQRLM